MTEESGLISKARLGNKEAINQLLNNYKHFAYTIAFRMVRNEFDANDIVQNAFISTFRNIHKLKNESTFSTWLYTVVYRESIRLIDKGQRKKETELDIKIVETNIYQVNESLEKLLIDERKEIINNALNKLNPNEHTLISLFYLEEKTIKEIQHITGLSKSNIKVILHRTRIQLFKILNSMLKTEVKSIL